MNFRFSCDIIIYVLKGYFKNAATELFRKNKVKFSGNRNYINFFTACKNSNRDEVQLI